MVYCSEAPATALLEVLANLDVDIEDVPTHYTLLKIEAPTDISMCSVDPTALPKDWRHRPSTTRKLGNAWIGSGEAALYKVPCVIVPEAWNILMNPLHPEHETIKIVKVYKKPFDTRLVPR